MPTPKQQYTDTLNELASRYGDMEDATARRILAMLRETRNQINGEIAAANLTDAGLYQMEALRGNIERLIADFQIRAEAEMRSSAAQAYDFGGLSAVEPLQVLGLPAVYSPSSAQVAVVEGYSAELITKLTPDILSKVDAQIKQATLGLITPFDAMKNITADFGKAKVEQGRMVTSGISAKAEMDVRTELQAVYNASNHAQAKDSARRIPGLTKRWIATADGRTRLGHLKAHQRYKAKPIPVDEKYEIDNWRYTKKRGWFIDRNSSGGGTTELMYPADLSGEPWATINCRCTQAVIAPGIGVIGSSLDGRVAAMIKIDEETGE